MRDEDLNVIEAMEKYGGSFVRALASAARHADPENLQKIKDTWPDYWAKYSRAVMYGREGLE